MGTKTVKVPLTNASIPTAYEQVSRSTVDNQDIVARLPGFFSGDVSNVDFGVPEVVYAENVMPFAKGIYSVGFAKQNSAAGAITTCDRHIPLRDIDENITAYLPANGANYVYDPATDTWTSKNPFTFNGSLITRAYVNGRTFICFEQNRIIEYDVNTGVFNTISLTYPVGLSINNVRGIGSASNYLLLFTDFTVYWCAPGNLLEFADMNQGAGNQTPIDIKGQITAILNVAGGFIIYTAKNAVGATYTNNAATPFIFKEVTNAGGVASWEQITPEADDTGHYVYGTNGLQFVGLNRAVTVFPEISDFLVGGQAESWNSTTKTVDKVVSAPPFYVKLSFLAGRYLVVSYGIGTTTTLQHALIYDTALKRWGKVRIDHTDAFTYGYTVGTGAYDYDDLPWTYDAIPGDYASLGLLFLAVTPPKQGIAFLKSNGEVWIMVPNFVHTGDTAVVILGRFQQRHGRKTTVHAIELDGLKSSPAPAVTLLGGANGYQRDSTTTMSLAETDSNYYKYTQRTTTENFDIAVEGTFVLSTVLVTVSMHGSR